MSSLTNRGAALAHDQFCPALRCRTISASTGQWSVWLTGDNDRRQAADWQVDFCCPSLLGVYKLFYKHYEKPILASREVGATKAIRENGQTKAEEVSLGR